MLCASTRLIFGLLAVNLASTGLSKIFNRRFQFLRLAAEPAYIGLPASSRGAAPDFETGPVCFLTLCRQLVAMLVTLLANIFFPKYSIFCPSYAIIYLPQFTYMRRREVGVYAEAFTNSARHRTYKRNFILHLQMARR